MKHITGNGYYQKAFKLIIKIADNINEQVLVSFLREYPAGRRRVGENLMAGEKKMQSIIKLFFLVAVLLVAAFFANSYGLVSIPWLDLNSVPTYSEDAIHMDNTLKKAFED